MMNILSILAVAAFLTLTFRIELKVKRSKGHIEQIRIHLSAKWQNDHLLI